MISSSAIPEDLSLTWTQLAIALIVVPIIVGPGKTSAATPDNGLSVRSEPGGTVMKYTFSGNPIFGGLLFGLPLLMLTYQILYTHNTGLGHWVGAAILYSGLCFFGLRAIIPVDVTTRFDTGSRRILRSLSICNGLYQAHQSFSLNEIVGVTIQKYVGEEVTYEPVLSMRNGKYISLARQSGRSDALRTFEKATREFCELTALPNLNVPPQSSG